MYQNNNLSFKQPPASQAAKEKAIKNRAARGGTEGDNDKVPCTSKFHFSKGKYGNVVLAWHGVLIQKAKANFSEICVQARGIFGATDVGNGSQLSQTVDPEISIRVGLDSESDSDEAGARGNNAEDGDDEDPGFQDHDDDSDKGEDLRDDADEVDEDLQDHDDDNNLKVYEDDQNTGINHGNDGDGDDVDGGNNGNGVDSGGPSRRGGRRSSRGGRKLE